MVALIVGVVFSWLKSQACAAAPPWHGRAGHTTWNCPTQCPRFPRWRRPLWWASNPEWLRELDGWLIVLRTDRDEVTLSAHRRFTATRRPTTNTAPTAQLGVD